MRFCIWNLLGAGLPMVGRISAPRRRGSLWLWPRRDEDAERLLGAAERILRAPRTAEGRAAPSPGDDIAVIHAGRKADLLDVALAPGERCCVKVFRANRVEVRRRTLLGLGRGRRAYQRGLQLECVGVDAPRVRGYLECRPWGPGLLFMDLVDGRETVRSLLARLRQGGYRARPDLYRLSRLLGAYVGGLHRKGVAHKDLITRNLLVIGAPPSPRFILLDFEDLRFVRGTVPRRARLAILRKLDSSVDDLPARERLRFLRAYLRAMGEPPRAARLARRLGA